MLFTIYAHRLEELQKQYKRLATKANAAGLETALNVGEPYIKEVKYYDFDSVNKCYTWNHKTTFIKVVDVDLQYPNYKLGSYDLIAIIDHTLSPTENAIYKFNDALPIPTKYRTAPPCCDHCRTQLQRNNTALLMDSTSGELKQVGINCLKEYTGINANDVIRAFIALEEAFEELDTERGYYTGGAPAHVATVDYIAFCVNYINHKGYSKDLKNLAFDEVLKERSPATDADRETARKVIDYFKSGRFDDEFLHNIHVNMQQEYTRENGLLAYSYKAYQKEMERAAKLEARAAEAAKTCYYGNVGDKVKNIEVVGRVAASYEIRVSYNNYVTTYIYEFKDSANHVFIWKSQKEIQLNDGGQFRGTISGTIKEHSEYNGTKQTVLTRCKTEAEQPEAEQQTSNAADEISEALQMIFEM